MARFTCWPRQARVEAKILQASTSEVYGVLSMHPQREDYWGNVNPIGPATRRRFFGLRRLHNLSIKVCIQVTIRQLADLVIELTGSPSKIVFRPLPQDDPKQRCPDISLSKTVLG